MEGREHFSPSSCLVGVNFILILLSGYIVHHMIGCGEVSCRLEMIGDDCVIHSFHCSNYFRGCSIAPPNGTTITCYSGLDCPRYECNPIEESICFLVIAVAIGLVIHDLIIEKKEQDDF